MNLAQLRCFQWAVRVTLAIGVAASVCANVLHARDNLIAQTIAAWPPLALLLTVELVSRVPVHRRGLAAARICATAAIAGIAAFVSYFHMAGVAARYGESGLAPYLLPLSVDGLVVVASVSLVELAGRVRAAHADEPRAENPGPVEAPSPTEAAVPVDACGAVESADASDAVEVATDALRPQTLYGIADSPVGLAAWLLDHNDADGQPAAAVVSALDRTTSATGELTRDEILDNITLYWLTNAGVSASRL